MINKKLPYEREPIPQDKKVLRFEPETIGSKISFGFCLAVGGFFFSSCLDRNLAIFKPVC
jgi:hypothetical protein